MSDALCRLADGTGFGTRALYTNAEEAVFAGGRPVIVNGIDGVVTQSDLGDRAIRIHLRRRPEGERRSEEEIMAEFRSAQPSLLGALLDGVVAALNGEADVKQDWWPRNIDVAKWVTAGEVGLGVTAGAFLAALRTNKEFGELDSLDHSPIYEPLRRLLKCAAGSVRMTPTHLLQSLGCHIGATWPPRGWPRDAERLSAELNRLSPNLRAAGITISRERSPGKDRSRFWVIQSDGSRPSPDGS
jgi:hypothetical protein